MKLWAVVTRKTKNILLGFLILGTGLSWFAAGVCFWFWFNGMNMIEGLEYLIN